MYLQYIACGKGLGCESVISYEVFVVSSFVPHLSFLLCLGRAVLRDLVFPGYLHLYILVVI